MGHTSLFGNVILFISCTFYWVFLAGKCISCRVSVYRFHRKLTASGPYRVCLAWGTWPGHPCLRSDWPSSQLASSSLGLPTQSRPRGRGVDKSLSTGASPCYGISVKMLEAVPPKRAGPLKVTPPPRKSRRPGLCSSPGGGSPVGWDGAVEGKAEVNAKSRRSSRTFWKQLGTRRSHPFLLVPQAPHL